ncbi:MAG TPA: S41 family peptidase [Symbiobacteriaceae bacterium]|nr:S41 family peptidase [Symbiobacteriaceae bacterium]
MTPELRTEVLNKVVELLDSRYVFAEVAAEVRRHLEARAAAGAYDGLAAAEFAQLVTDDMQSISRDKHMRLRPQDPSRFAAAPTPENMADFLRRRKQENYGFVKLERLEANVGYMDLRGFQPPEFAGETAVAAMQFLSNADALIFDLRQCPGGSPGMVALLTTYLFEQQILLNTFYNRAGEVQFQNYTLPHVPGRRMPDVPVYVLTSSFTFSAAEEFTYNLKSRNRATIVGEKTGGGANPGSIVAVGAGLELFVSAGRAVNPITKDNWEGKGIEPDIAVPADQALEAALAHARETLAKK